MLTLACCVAVPMAVGCCLTTPNGIPFVAAATQTASLAKGEECILVFIPLYGASTNIFLFLFFTLVLTMSHKIFLSPLFSGSYGFKQQSVVGPLIIVEPSESTDLTSFGIRQYEVFALEWAHVFSSLYMGLDVFFVSPGNASLRWWTVWSAQPGAREQTAAGSTPTEFSDVSFVCVLPKLWNDF